MRRLLALAIALAAASPGVAQACSCRRSSLEELVGWLAVVFDGTVNGRALAVPAPGSAPLTHAFQFKVRRLWKGDVGPVFSVAYPIQDAACGVTLRDGEAMLVGAIIMSGRALSNSCVMLNMNQPTLDYVRELGSPIREHRR